VRVDSTVMFVLLGVKSYEGAAFAYEVLRLLSHSNATVGRWELRWLYYQVNGTGIARVFSKVSTRPAGYFTVEPVEEI